MGRGRHCCHHLTRGWNRPAHNQLVMAGRGERRPLNRQPLGRPMAKRPPPLPNSVGKRRKIINIWGEVRYWRIEDEICRLQSGAPHKVICFQKLRREEDGLAQFRFGYYMLGVKPGARGRWVWGQYALFIPRRDLKALIRKAEKRGWI